MSSRSSKSDPFARRPEFITVGRVRKPHGVRGEVSVGVLSDVKERFAAGSTVEVVAADDTRRSVPIKSVRGGRKGEVIVAFEGCENREEAEKLRGAMLEISRSSVPAAPPGSFYYFELVGCECVDKRTGLLGQVTDVLEDGGGLLLEISAVESTLLVPFVQAYLVDMDTQNLRIELELPPGLVDTCRSAS